MSRGPDLLVTKSAIISLYRRTLTRRWSDGPLMLFAMLNPSTADAEIDDPTLNRTMGFARREKMAGVWLENLYDLRSTDPKALSGNPNRASADNLYAHAVMISYAIENGIGIICAWGSNKAVSTSGDEFVTRCRAAGVPTLCLGKTDSGAPRHPLYVLGNQRIEAFE
jgi:hypothetical protein